jgi:gamma-glutamylcyclotransferase (GGCT)/AIG2-like uncharacterized protein YtfP
VSPTTLAPDGAGLAFLGDYRLDQSQTPPALIQAVGVAVPGRLFSDSDSELATTPPRSPRLGTRAVLSDGRLLNVTLSSAEDTAHVGATGAGGSGFPGAVFVYGTLMHGEERHAAISNHLPHVAPTPGSVAGRLVHLGAWPGMRDGDERVAGELYVVKDPSVLVALLAVLDPIEDFEGYDAPPTRYVRVVLPVTTAHGVRWAWAYRYVGTLAGAVPIPSGRWRDAPPRLPSWQGD